MRAKFALIIILILLIVLVKSWSNSDDSARIMILTSSNPHYTGYELKCIADEISPNAKNVLNWDRKTGLSEGVLISLSDKDTYFIPHAVNVTINHKPLQIKVKTPNGTSYEETAHVCQELGKYLQAVADVKSYQSYIEDNKAEIYINGEVIAKKLRPSLKDIADKYNARIKFSGLNPITVEIHGPVPEKRIEIAREVKNVFNSTNGVVDVDLDDEGRLPCVTANLENPMFNIIRIKTHLPKLEKGYSVKWSDEKN